MMILRCTRSMATDTKFLHTHTCDMCGYVIVRDIPGALDPELAVKFTVEAPGVRQYDNGHSQARTVLVCKNCQDNHTVGEFAVWLERTKE